MRRHTPGRMQGSRQPKRDHQLQRPCALCLGIPPHRLNHPLARLLKRKPERLVPPPGPPPREPLVQHERVRPARRGVHPGLCACADDVGPQDAGEEQRREREDGLQRPLDAELAEDEAEGVREDFALDEECGEVRGEGAVEVAPEVGVVRADGLDGVEDEVACEEGLEVGDEEGAAGGVDVGLGDVGAEGVGWGIGGVAEELFLDGFGMRGGADGAPVPGCAAEVAEEVYEEILVGCENAVDCGGGFRPSTDVV